MNNINLGDQSYASLRELLESLSSEQIKNQELLLSISFSLRSFTNLSRFLELVPLVLSRLLNVDSAIVIPFDDKGKISKELIQIFPFDKYETLRIELFKFSLKYTLQFDNQKEYLHSLDLLIQKYFRGYNLFSTSIVSRGRQRGRIYVFHRNAGSPWSDIHSRNLQIIADLAAVAIENDIFLQQLRTHESVDRQLSIGADIQAQLLPDHCPVIEGIQLAARCCPAFQLGGDYYDFIPTTPLLGGPNNKSGRWAFVIGDVMGKGIPAGLLMTMIRGMLRAEVLSGLPPNRILHDLNQLALKDLSQSHRFVTLFYSDFDPYTRKLRFANAAHNPPLLWKSSSKEISRLDVPGLLIGLQSNADFLGGEIFLEPGDVILYYTDGVTEAVGISGERFGEKRLANLFAEVINSFDEAQKILDNLYKRLDSFVGLSNHLEDDASMVVLKVNEDLKLPEFSSLRT